MIQFITRNKILTIYPILWQWLLHTVLDGNRLFISDSSCSVFWDSISSTTSSANEQDNIQLQLPIVSAGAKEEQWGDRSTNRRQDKMKLYHYNRGAFIIIQEQEGWTQFQLILLSQIHKFFLRATNIPEQLLLVFFTIFWGRGRDSSNTTMISPYWTISLISIQMFSTTSGSFMWRW